MKPRELLKADLLSEVVLLASGFLLLVPVLLILIAAISPSGGLQ